MPIPIVPIQSPTAAAPVGPKKDAGSAQAGFGDSLTRLVDTAEASSAAANSAVEQMLEGKGDIHDAMIALQRAELTLQLTVQMRNKLVQAYQDIMRMPV